MIYQTVLLYKFCEIITKDENGFSLAGAGLVYDYLDSIGEPIEFDPVAIRCEWTEYPDPFDAMLDFFGIEYLENERPEYQRFRSEGQSPAEALESVLGVPVLWDKQTPDSYVVGC